MHASLYYEYGMMLCINTPAPELRDVIRAGRTLKVGRWRADLELELPQHETTISALRQEFEAHVSFLRINLEPYNCPSFVL
jgi:hypothetical protein